MRRGEEESLRRPGLSDFSPCVSGRQWFELKLRRRRRLDGRASTRFVFNSLYPMGRQSALSALHRVSMGSNPSVFPSTSSTKGNRRSAFKGLREVSTTEHATPAGQQENLSREGEWCAQTISHLQHKRRVNGFGGKNTVSRSNRYAGLLSFAVTQLSDLHAAQVSQRESGYGTTGRTTCEG